MDPSEFEDTVEKEVNVLDAGALELLLTNGPLGMDWKPLDLQQECSDICLAVFNLKEGLVKWNEVSLVSVFATWDESAIKIAEMKEEYLRRRKALAKDIKSFKDQSNEETDLETLRTGIDGVIEKFKAEFDYLANLYKFSESVFLNAYKLMRDSPDPVSLIDNSLKTCLKAHDILKQAQEQMNVAAEKIDKLKTNNVSVNDEEIILKFQTEKEEQQQKHAIEIKELKSRFESDMKIREQQIRDLLEQQHIETQSKLQIAMEKKDQHIQSLIQSLSQAQTKALEADEREKITTMEIQRRRDLEDKIRNSLTDQLVAEEKVQSVTAELDLLTQKMEALESTSSNEISRLQIAVQQLETERRLLETQCESYQSELKYRPPLDLKNIIDKLGMLSDQINIEETSTGATLPWETVESIVIDVVRKSQAAAADSRVKEHEALNECNTLKSEVAKLNSILREKSEIVASLESDIFRAQSALESKAWSGVQSNSTNNNHNNASRESKSNQAINMEGFKAVVDTVMEDSRAESAPNDNMIQALQNQRDRYMKLAGEREREIMELKVSIERTQEAQKELKNENLELYRRLRVLRASSRGVNSASYSDVENSSLEGEDALLSRRFGSRDVEASSPSKNPRSKSDALDSKYGKLYQDTMDPFRMEELDRQTYLSTMDVWDRYLAVSIRCVMQDKITRRAVLIYFVLVHLLACGYVFQVLNPQLIEEVDAYAKSQFAKETLDYDMHREHPDV